MREARVALAGVPSLASGLETYAFLAEYRYASMLRRERRLAEAERAARRQLETAIAGASVPAYSRADAHWLLGGVLSDRGRFAEAERHLRAAFDSAADPGQSRIRVNRGALELAKLYLRWGRARDAEPLFAHVSRTSADSVRRLAADERARRLPPAR
jgi:tetratricopeptide (TPR) repeat protein